MGVKNFCCILLTGP